MTAFLAIRMFAGRAWGWITASTSHLLIVACAGLALLLMRAEHHADKWHRAAGLAMKALHDEQASYKAAQVAAAAAQRAANDAAEAKSRQIAKDADDAYDSSSLAARAAANRYVHDHSLRAACAGGALGRTDRAAEADSSDVPTPLPASPVVLSAADVQAAADLEAYALAAHNEAMDWITAGLAQ